MAVAVLALSGCGSAADHTSAVSTGAVEHCETLDAASQAGAASRLLARVSTPLGLRPSPLEPVDLRGLNFPTPQLDQPPQGPAVGPASGFRVADCYRWWVSRGSLRHVLNLFNGHVRGLSLSGTGAEGEGRGLNEQTTLLWRNSAAMHAGKWTSQMYISVVPLAGGRVGVRADGVVATNGPHIDLKYFLALLGETPAPCQGLPTAKQTRPPLVLFGAIRKLDERLLCARFGIPTRVMQLSGGRQAWRHDGDTFILRHGHVLTYHQAATASG